MTTHHNSPFSKTKLMTNQNVCTAGHQILTLESLLKEDVSLTSSFLAPLDTRVVLELPVPKGVASHSALSAKEAASIHEDFQSRVQEVDSDIVAFANRYGLLGVDTCGVTRSQDFQLLRFEPVASWLHEAKLVRAMSDILRISRSRAEHEDEAYDSLTRVLTELADSRYMDTGPLVTRKLSAKERMMSRFKWVLQNKIDGLGGVRLDVTSGNLSFSPHNLLGLVYVGLFDEFFRRRRVHRKCRWCGFFFPIRNVSKQICSKKCENALYRERQRLKQGAGEVPQVMAQQKQEG